jgi:hypothetical protein
MTLATEPILTTRVADCPQRKSMTGGEGVQLGFELPTCWLGQLTKASPLSHCCRPLMFSILFFPVYSQKYRRMMKDLHFILDL